MDVCSLLGQFKDLPMPGTNHYIITKSVTVALHTLPPLLLSFVVL